MAFLRFLLLSASLFASVLTARTASAQRFDLERFAPALDTDGFIGVQGTRTPGPGNTVLALFSHYASSVLSVDQPDGRQTDAIAGRLGAALGAQLGIGKRLALGFGVPVVMYQHGDAQPGPALRAFAAGDPSLLLRYRFVGDVATGLLRNDDGPGLALQLSGTLPAGYEDAYAGEGAARAELQLLADMHLLSAGIGASLGFRHRFAERTLLDVRVREEMTFGVALKLPIPPLYPLEGLLELRGATDFGKSASTALELDLGARYPLGKGWTLQVAAGPGLTGAVGTPGMRVIAGVFYAPADPDSDEDGVPDSSDACPPLPEDRDGFQDTDGCPDPDNDNDLVPDADDLCPDQQAAEDRDDNEDGCTD